MKDTGISSALEPQSSSDEKWWKIEKSAMRDDLYWISIGVVSYHNDVSAILPDEVSTSLVWQNYPMAVAFGDALAKQLSPDRFDAVFRDALAECVGGHGGVSFREDPIDTGMSAYLVSGSIETVKKYVFLALQNVVADAAEVGGDDSYFDYYPDEVYILYQLCRALGMKAEYLDAYKTITEGRYAGETEDVIPRWGVDGV